MLDLKMKILVVDDDAAIRRIVKGILKQIGFAQIVEAANGKDALKLLAAGGFSLIMSDWNMPEMKGIELLSRIRADARLRDITFVMITSESKTTNILQAVKAGVNCYITKPFTAETVLAKLNKIFAAAYR